jgi:hypothetical protein
MTLLAKKPADDIREMWQARALRESAGVLRKVLITALAKEWPGELEMLMRVVFPGFVDIDRPMIVSYGTISPAGRVCCEVIDRAGLIGVIAIYESENDFLVATRNLADRLKLDDADRIAMFAVLQKWITKDLRARLAS